MRLTCPNCGAQYEVPDAVIPAAGRDVQCSNCGDTWFQAPPDGASGPVEAPALTPGIAPAPRVSPRRPRSQADSAPRPDEAAAPGLTGDGAGFEGTDPYGAETPPAPEPEGEPGSEPMTWPEVEPQAEPEVEPAPEEIAAAPDAEATPEETPESWTEAAAEPAPAPAPEDDAEEEDEESTPAPLFANARRRELDPAVRDVLREEAEHEAKVRAQQGGGLESQPELGLADPESSTDRREREARARMARLRGKPTPDSAQDSGDDAQAEEPHAASRRDLLPDIEEINSSLRSRSQRVEMEAEYEAEDPAVRRNFRRGFTLPIFFAAFGVLLYINAPRIAAQLPQTAPALRGYVGAVDQGRVWLDANVRELIAWIEDKTGGEG